MEPQAQLQDFLANAFSIRLLGGFEVQIHGEVLVKPSYEKGRALLAYLAAEGGWHSREKLASLFWPGLTRESARNNLRLVLLNLRQWLHDSENPIPVFLSDRHSLCVNPKIRPWIDFPQVTAASAMCALPSREDCAVCIEQMEYTVDLYRGDFLEGFFLPGCPEFEDWLLVKREGIRRHAADLLDRLANRFEEAGMRARALPFALRYVTLDPWNEAGYRRTIRLYASLGQIGAALGQYETCVRTLKENLDAQPNEETRQLAKRLKKGELAQHTATGLESGKAPARSLALTEWRQASVVYCKAAPLESAESDRSIMALDRFKARCSVVLRRFSGHVVLPYIGGVFAYFGYPRASENAARQAVRSALAAVLEAGESGLEVRAGVHTGLIATGSDRTLPDASGVTSAFTAGLLAAARNREVVISGETQQLVAGYFDSLSAGMRDEPGMPGPIEIFVVSQEIGAAARIPDLP